MQQPHNITTYADIGEVRTVTGVAACNQLLAEGWVLLGVFPVTGIGEMGEGQPGEWTTAQTDRGHAAVCAAVSGLCCGKEARIVKHGNVHAVFLFLAS
jgi:hypothetical protein